MEEAFFDARHERLAMKKLKVALAYNAYSEKAMRYHEYVVSCAKACGLDFYSVVCTPNPPRTRFHFQELDRKVLFYDWGISKFRDALVEQLQEADVLWLFNGGNFHPAWLKLLPANQLKIYSCHDDPESSHDLSLPVAPYFDACLIGNISAIPLYQGYTRRPTEWTPLFTSFDIPRLQEKDFSARQRTNGLVFCGERESLWRRERLDYVQQNFRDGIFYGRGWPNGFHANHKKLYLSSKIGINIHNSIGPINIRLHELPSCGVLQICDNKSRLGHIYKINKEVIGFDYVSEAIDKIRYFLDPVHEQERQEVAWNGHQRFLQEYTHEKILLRNYSLFERWYEEKEKGILKAPEYLNLSFRSKVRSIANKSSSAKKVYSVAKEISKVFKRELQLKMAAETLPKLHIADSCPVDLGEKLRLPLGTQSETGPLNFDRRESIIQQCGFFEYPNMVALNWAVASLVGDAKKIVEMGSGLGCFAFDAGQDSSRSLLCLEEDAGARGWAQKHRALSNVSYDSISLHELKPEFDLAVSIDVLEHIEDYQAVLSELSRIAPRGIFTTPNRMRETPPRLCPGFYQHVREWSAGEFYYMLRQFYNNVYLLSMPDCYVPVTVSIDINSTLTPLTAVCENN